MSPNNPGNFVNDLVEMAKAFEALPKVQADLAQAHADIETYATSVQRLELKLMERSGEITGLLDRVRSLEVERDDAQFHALEADDRTSRALDFIKATFGNAGSLIQALEPARPVEPQTETNSLDNEQLEPVRPAEAMTTGDNPQDHLFPSELSPTSASPSGQSESPLPVATEVSSQSAYSTTETIAVLSTSTSPASEVASAHPMPNVLTEYPLSNGAPDASETGTNEPGGFSMPAASPGRYAGRCYSEVTASGDYPNRAEWEANGGTVDNWFA